MSACREHSTTHNPRERIGLSPWPFSLFAVCIKYVLNGKVSCSNYRNACRFSCSQPYR